MLNAINLAQVGLVNASVRLDASARRTVETTIDARAVEPVEQIIATQQFSANTATSAPPTRCSAPCSTSGPDPFPQALTLGGRWNRSMNCSKMARSPSIIISPEASSA